MINYKNIAITSLTFDLAGLGYFYYKKKGQMETEK